MYWMKVDWRKWTKMASGEEGERLQKVLASAGVASRRRAEDLILRGDVVVNGHVAVIGERVDPRSDQILVRGQLINQRQGKLYLALNKPEGYVTSARSTHGERTVFDLIDVDQRVYPVGRLDKDTSGLLLLTDDGEWANLIAHPRYMIEKEYQVVIHGLLSPIEAQRLARGLVLPDRSVPAPAKFEVLSRSHSTSRVRVVLTQGKKRQIRLLFGALDHPVVKLTRVRIGDILLAGLQTGSWRRLTSDEVQSIRESIIVRT